MAQTSHLYLIALGSNKRHHLLGRPERIIRHAFDALEMEQMDIFATSRIHRNRPLGPSNREFANAAALLVSPLLPPALLNRLQMVEHHFGRRDRGQRWRERQLDLDIVLWSGGMWKSERPALSIPHDRFSDRPFVLAPATQIAPQMRDPLTGRTIAQLYRQLLRPKPLDPSAKPA